MARREEPMSEKEIIEVRRNTLKNNLETYGITLPGNLISTDGLPTTEALELIEGLIHRFTYTKVVNIQGIGLGYFLSNLRRVLQIGASLSSDSEQLVMTREQSLPKESQSTKIHFIPQESELRFKDFGRQEILRRERHVIGLLNNDHDGAEIFETGIWLLGKLNEVFGEPFVYLSDLIHPPPKESKKNSTSPAYLGIYSLSEALGLGPNMGLEFEASVQELKKTKNPENVFEQHFSPLLKHVSGFLDQYDNPDELIATKLNVIRHKTKKYFPNGNNHQK